MKKTVVALFVLSLSTTFGCSSEDTVKEAGVGGATSSQSSSSPGGSGGAIATQTTFSSLPGGTSNAGGDTPSGGSGGSTGPSTGGTGGADTVTTVISTVPAEVSVSGLAPKAVSAQFFGQNYWSWVPDWGDPVADVESDTKELHLKLLRAGGANNDQQSPKPFTLEEVDGFVEYASSVGAEPLLQVPLLKNLSGEAASAQDAADLVTYVNVTKNYGIKYFSIGNEPDLYVDQSFQDAGYSASAFCSTFKEFATKMRDVDPTIKIVGPDLSWKYVSGANDWLTPFLENCGDVVDIVAVHRYPLAPEACSEAAAYGDAPKYRQTIKQLRAKMDATGQGEKPLAITEANITYDGTPAKSKLAASPGTFPAALWLADNIGVSLEEQLYSVAYWSLSEGWTLGFFSTTGPRPVAHVFKLFSSQFGSEVLTVTGATNQISVYSGRDAANSRTSLYVVNKTKNALALKVGFTDLPRTEGLELLVSPTSLQVVMIPDDGALTVTNYDGSMKEPTAAQ